MKLSVIRTLNAQRSIDSWQPRDCLSDNTRCHHDVIMAWLTSSIMAIRMHSDAGRELQHRRSTAEGGRRTAGCGWLFQVHPWLHRIVQM